MVEAPPHDLVERLGPWIADFLLRVFLAEPPSGVGASSWWRDFETNIRVGGAPRSQHRLALAVDLTGVRSPGFLARLRAFGLTVIDEGDHVHVQYLAAGAATRAGLFEGHEV